MTMLKSAQKTLTVGDDKPFPGGFANGVGKGSPEIPWMKWGTAFAKNVPAKKQAMEWAQVMADSTFVLGSNT